MKGKQNRMPKLDYFKMRYTQAVESGNLRKAEYFKGRIEQLGGSVEPPTYNTLVNKAVRVLNAPEGSVQAKQAYILGKLKQEGKTEAEAMVIFLEALNIASDGELLNSV